MLMSYILLCYNTLDVDARIFHKTGSNLFKSSTVNGKEPTNKRNSESDNSSVASDSVTSKNDENVMADRKREAKEVVDEKCSSVGVESLPRPPEAPSIEINLDEIFKTPLTDMMGEVNVCPRTRLSLSLGIRSRVHCCTRANLGL